MEPLPQVTSPRTHVQAAAGQAAGPLVGLTCAAAGDSDASTALTAALREAGAVVVLVPPDDAIAQRPGVLLDRLDALVLGDGPAVDPASYGGGGTEPGADPERDRFELGLAYAAAEGAKPLLGHGRGLAILNVALGGTAAGGGIGELGDGLTGDGDRIEYPGRPVAAVRAEPSRDDIAALLQA